MGLSAARDEGSAGLRRSGDAQGRPAHRSDRGRRMKRSNELQILVPNALKSLPPLQILRRRPDAAEAAASGLGFHPEAPLARETVAPRHDKPRSYGRPEIAPQGVEKVQSGNG